MEFQNLLSMWYINGRCEVESLFLLAVSCKINGAGDRTEPKYCSMFEHLRAQNSNELLVDTISRVAYILQGGYVGFLWALTTHKPTRTTMLQLQVLTWSLRN